jgi:UDP-glucuronate 4-epimerase
MTEMAPGDVLATYADVSHARSMLGYSPKTSIDVGLRKFIRWYRSEQFQPEFAEDGEWKK